MIGRDFTVGRVELLLLEFVFPFLLSNLLNSVYNTVDMVVIGHRMGSVGTVAVSMGGRMLTMFTHVSASLCSGGQVLLAQQLGAGERKALGRTIGTLFTLLAVVSVVVAAASFVLADPILRLIRTPCEALSSAEAYLRITCIGLPFIFGYNAVCSVLRGMGDSKRPLLFIGIAAVINLVLDLIFILGLEMGAAGTALATVVGQSVAFVLAVVQLYHRRDQFGFDFCPENFRPQLAFARIICRVGFPMTVHALSIQLTQLLLLRYVNDFGLAASSAWNIADKFLGLANTINISVRQAGGTIVAQNLGARKPDRVRQLVKSALKINLTCVTGFAALAILFPDAVFGLFTSETAVLAYSRSFILISALTFYLAAISSAFDTVTVGSGNARLSMIAGLMDGVVLRIGLSFLLGFGMGMGVVGFYLGNTLARLSPVCFHGIYFLGGSWQRRKRLMD